MPGFLCVGFVDELEEERDSWMRVSHKCDQYSYVTGWNQHDFSLTYGLNSSILCPDMRKKSSIAKQNLGKPRQGRRSFEDLAGVLGTNGKMLKSLLEERRKDREREEAKIRRFASGRK